MAYLACVLSAAAAALLVAPSTADSSVETATSASANFLARSVSSLLRTASSTAQSAGANRSEEDAFNDAFSLAMHVGPPVDSENMRFLLKLLGKYRKLATDARNAVEERHHAEAERLESSAGQTRDEAVKLALLQSKVRNERTLSDTSKVFDNIQSFSESVESVITAASKTGACDAKDCGEHSSCTETSAGAQCVCNEGFVGTGTNCAAPPEFRPHRILYEGTGGVPTKAFDLSITAFSHNKIAIVFRDASKGHIGRIVLGSVREAGMADLSPPEQFTVPFAKAYSPVVAGTEGENIAVAWRDQNRDGACWLRAASLGGTGVRGADMALTWGEPQNVCGNHQSHKMALVPLFGEHVALMMSDKVMATDQLPQESFGTALLAKLNTGGQVSMSSQRFFEFPVCRLEVTRISPTAFVIGARAGPAVDDMDSSVTSQQQAVGILGQLVGSDLVFDTTPVNLEPKAGQIWSRGLSLIAPNTVAYAYQDGMSQQMKMGVIKVNADDYTMQVVNDPVVIRDGFSPYISMLSVPYSPNDPHTLTYFESAGASKVNLCSWDTFSSKLTKCQDFTWHPQKLSTVSGVHLGGGKSFMVFAEESGTPYYSVFGLSKV